MRALSGGLRSMAAVQSAPLEKLDMLGLVARLHGESPWGAVLDAGSGARSARWLSALPTTRWTALSADAEHLALCEAAVGPARRPQDRFVLGDWRDPQLLAGERYDVVLADYLLGAVEGYAPYFQSELFARLRPLIGARLYVVGADPILFGPAEGEAGRLVQALARLRDACALLAGVSPYREYPAEWVLRRLEAAGLEVEFARRFPNSFGADWLERQLGDVGRLIALAPQGGLGAALQAEAESLRARARELLAREGALLHGHDYAIAARPR